MSDNQIHLVYIALGSNLGNRSEHLHQASDALAPSVHVLESSPIYETPPWGVIEQPPYLNQVLKAETSLDAESLLAYLKGLEAELGRVVGVRYGPRVIDLDLLFYDDLVLETPLLAIPHPRMRGRGFVMVPMADLAPDLVHPVFKKSIADLLAECDMTGIHVFE